MKFCKDCKWYVDARTGAYGFTPSGCKCPALEDERDPVTGQLPSPYDMRLNKKGLCNKEGYFFQAKEEA